MYQLLELMRINKPYLVMVSTYQVKWLAQNLPFGQKIKNLNLLEINSIQLLDQAITIKLVIQVNLSII